MLQVLVPALSGLAHTTESLSSSACLSVCKYGNWQGTMQHNSVRHFEVVWLKIKQWAAVVFWQVVGNKMWGLFCYKCAAGRSLLVALFLEVLVDASIFDLFTGLQLESVSLMYLTALTFTVLQSMESFSSSRPLDRTGPDDMEILSEERWFFFLIYIYVLFSLCF